MSKIVIGVACHKESELPKSSLYLPIHVGAALASKEIPGLQRDDEGDNISEKNPMYCELTAQYWLWKNVDADYYGLSHYRRYISFAPGKFTNFTNDNRKQVRIESLNDYTQSKYYLDNEDAMRAIIESHDIVATENQDLSVVYTPRGRKKSVYEHFVAHDHDLINKHDLDNVIRIVKEQYPQYYEDMMEYINKPAFRGFNCFVMKKDLFFEMCEFEFGVLAELEKIIDVSTYDLTRTRVYGFMAEILYSSFVYHVQKRRSANVYDAQMLFFVDTDPKKDLLPIEGAKPFVFNLIDTPGFLFDVTLSSFLDHISEESTYDVILLHQSDLAKTYKNYYLEKVKAYPNVTLRFLDWGKPVAALVEGLKPAYFVPCLLFPWVLRRYDEIVMLNWNVLFEECVDNLASFEVGDRPLAAAYDIEWQGRVNSIFPEDKEEVVNYIGVKDPYKLFSLAVMKYNLSYVREHVDIWDVFKFYKGYRDQIGDSAAMNVLYEGKIAVLPQKYNVRIATYGEFKGRIADAPLALNKEYQAAAKSPAVVQYDIYDPWWTVGADHEVEFWSYVDKSAFKSMFFEQMTFVHTVMKGKRREKGVIRTRIDKLLPKGTKRRAIALKAMPRGSARMDYAKRVTSSLYNRFR